MKLQKQFDKCKNEAEIRVFPKYMIYKHYTLFVVYNIQEVVSEKLCAHASLLLPPCRKTFASEQIYFAGICVA